ncbi:hypothetical protein RISK_001412 [Rhodopirellula islandica]|uniref:Uncharacterized protein n=1 Tax=Rhodopirellula islandica TaxID=595434 RepID=A0A0J1BJG1_RHOIS|nr:hypothetical protein RISK_001412 [Rhodopirellula islandica]
MSLSFFAVSKQILIDPKTRINLQTSVPDDKTQVGQNQLNNPATNITTRTRERGTTPGSAARLGTIGNANQPTPPHAHPQFKIVNLQFHFFNRPEPTFTSPLRILGESGYFIAMRSRSAGVVRHLDCFAKRRCSLVQPGLTPKRLT